MDIDPDLVPIGPKGYTVVKGPTSSKEEKKSGKEAGQKRIAVLRPAKLPEKLHPVWHNAVAAVIKAGKILKKDGSVNYPAVVSTFRRMAVTFGGETMQDKEQDCPPASGSGAFATDSKAPLKDMTQPDDVKTPDIRDKKSSKKSGKKEGSRKASVTEPQEGTTWDILKRSLISSSRIGGIWNDGQFAVTSDNYGKVVELNAEARGPEGMPLSAGSVGFTCLHDAPSGRYATIEIADGVVENRTTEVTIQRKNAKRFAHDWSQRVAEAARAVLN